jgi:hypothetical protein
VVTVVMTACDHFMRFSPVWSEVILLNIQWCAGLLRATSRCTLIPVLTQSSYFAVKCSYLGGLNSVCPVGPSIHPSIHQSINKSIHQGVDLEFGYWVRCYQFLTLKKPVCFRCYAPPIFLGGEHGKEPSG